MKDNILEMKNIYKSFGGVKALQGVSFSCVQGEVHVMIGENGAGKSTILKILSGIHQADSGEIFIDGKQVFFKNPQEAQDKGIGMVFQELTVLPQMTVAKNIFLNSEYTRNLGLINNKKIRQEIQNMMDKYGIYVEPDDLVEDLPLAKQQMVEILKVLIKNPRIIIFDEPTSSLTREEVIKLYGIIRQLQTQNKTIIFISHRLKEVYEIGDRASVLKDGKLVGTVALGNTTPEEVIKLMVGRPLQAIFPHKCVEESSKRLFEVQGLKWKDKLKGINFSVQKGEIIGIAGLQGHGQKELLCCLAGVLKKDAGRIILNGRELSVNSAIQAIRKGIAFVPEDRKTEGLFLNLPVGQNLAAASMHLRKQMGFIRLKKEKAYIEDCIRRLSIKALNASQNISHLSGGNQQKVVLGKGLGTEPKVLLFDEPTRGIDIETKQEFYKIMRKYAECGVPVVFYSSDLMEVIGMSDRVLVMYDGRISGEIHHREMTEENIMRSAVGMAAEREGK